MANEFVYALVATNQVTGGMPDANDPGKAGMAVKDGSIFPRGYMKKKGDWNPTGLGVKMFDSVAEADAWLAGKDGNIWAADFELISLFQIKK